jgi:hypothetical protein
MKTTGNIRLAALAVVANGLIALVAMAPRTALAQSCSPLLHCNGCWSVAQCQTIAPAGCTASGAQCGTFPPGTGCEPTGVYTVCSFT